MKKWTLLLFLPIWMTLLFPVLGTAETPIHIFVGAPGKNKIPVALPLPVGNSGPALEFHRVIANDLRLSGWVDVVDPAAYVEPVGVGVRSQDFRFDDWEITGAMGLAKTKVVVGDNIRTEVWVYDVAGRKKLGAMAFSGSHSNIRTIAHKAANEIIYRLTGRQAPFNTRFAVIGNFRGNKELYLVDFDGENRTPITRNGSINLQPSWSLDGSRIAFTSYLNGNPDVYIANLSLGNITRISSRRGINIGADWRPDGGALAITLAPRGNPDVFTISSEDGKQLSRLTKTHGIDASPTWSPDGSTLAFVSERSGGAQIFLMNADGGNVRRLTHHGSHNTDPAFSPDGKRIVFVGRKGVFDIYTIRTDGTGLVRVTEGMGDNEDPSWSPDGNFVAFSSTRTGHPHIFMSTIDGTHQVQLTQGPGGYTNPDWSPPVRW